MSRPRFRNGLVEFAAAGLLLTLAGSDPAIAQTWRTDATITSQATLTNNANYQINDAREPDLIINVSPSVGFWRQGGSLRVAGSASLNMIGYVDGTQTSRIFPQANILANLEAIDRIFFIDASLLVNQEVLNPFLPRSDDASTFNKYTFAQGRIVPYLQGNWGLNTHWLIRSDNSYTLTTQTNAPLNNGYYGQQLAEIVRTPTPLGWTVRATSDVTRIRDQVQPDQTLETAIAIVNYAFTAQLTLGLRGGYERTNYTAEETTGPIYGFDIAWSPSPITRLAGFWEDRFFGSNYRFDFSHRQRMLATSMAFSRSVATYPQLLLQIPSTGNVAGLLDAILIARFPDPVVRAQQVQSLINMQGLPSSLPGGVNIYSQSANVYTSANANFALMGTRNTIALNIFYLKTDQLPDARVPPTFITFNNSIQQGAGISLNHRLDATKSLSGSITGFETRGFGPSEGLSSTQGIAQVQVNWQVTPRNSVFTGARYQMQHSESSTFNNSSEAAIFAGLLYAL